MKAISVTEFGGPEVLTLAEVPDPVAPAGSGLELLSVQACGVNYADTHAVENSYLSDQKLPMVPGAEVLGTLPDGRRVCGFTATGSGGYAESALVNPAAVFDVPDGVTDQAALGLLVQRLTAWHLLRTSARLQPGESVVVHAAAGGVGSTAVQLAKLWGAGRVIATASTAEKRALALGLGADAASTTVGVEVAVGRGGGVHTGPELPKLANSTGLTPIINAAPPQLTKAKRVNPITKPGRYKLRDLGWLDMGGSLLILWMLGLIGVYFIQCFSQGHVF